MRIDRLAAGGAGVGRLPSGAVAFVRESAPGDLVEVEVNTAARTIEGRVLRVIEPSPERVAVPCAHATSCGGCDWIHLALPAQEAAHAAIVRDAIRRALPAITLPEVRVHAAPAASAYRARARLYARGERGRARVGYRAPGSHKLAAVEACMVLDPALEPAFFALPEVLAGAGGEGDLQLAIGHGGRPVVDVTWRGELPASAWAAFDAHVRRGAWAGASVRFEGATKPASFGDPRPVMTGADGRPLIFPSGGFAQTSDAGAAMLARRVDELARLPDGIGGPVWKEARPRHVIELFAGSGTLSILLAQGTASFTAIELDAEAAAANRHNLAERGLDAKVVAADADTFALPPKTEVVVLDPPRAGAPGAAKAIAASSARVVVYVACDPATLARDLAVITGGPFAITHVETFELFPQTSHIETVVRLARVRGRKESS